MCDNCGNVGWTIEVNDDGEEYIEGCDDCAVKFMEADTDYQEVA